MPLLPLNRETIAKARVRLGQFDQALRLASAVHAQAADELRAARRAGGSRADLVRRQKLVAQRAKQVRQAAATAGKQLAAVRRLSDQLLGARDPALMVESLSTAVPVMLMPVAIQTRYDDATAQWMIRVYPDVLHQATHQAGLTPPELAEAQRYWTQRFATPGDAASPWTQITRLYGPMRAAYLVRCTTPTNLAQLGPAVAPVFDLAAIPRAAAGPRQTVATALPDRFVALGFVGGREVLRKWGSAVGDLLPTSPLFDPLLAGAPETGDPFDGDRAWMVSYPAAVAAGMGITVTQADLAAGVSLSQGFDRLIVLGVDWTQTPASAADQVADLFAGHRHGAGLAFVAQGTPTNNTGSERAGFAANGADLNAALQPEAADARAAAAADELDSAGARLQELLGLPRERFDAGKLPGADLAENPSAAHMLNALWNATLGYTLRYFWNPLDTRQTLISDDAIEQLRAFAVRFLRPSGPIAALRVGNQPYGLLPVAAGGYVPRADAPLERELSEVLTWFRGFWEVAVPRVPTLADASAQSLHQVLAMQPVSLGKRYWEVAGPAAVANADDIQPFAYAQGLFLHLVIDNLLQKWPAAARGAFLATCAVRPRPHALDGVPWVQRDPDHPLQELPAGAHLTRDYLQQLLDLFARPADEVRLPLTKMENGESLLEAMLAFAADEEWLQSGQTLFRDHLRRQPQIPAEIMLRAQRLRPMEQIGIDTPTLAAGQFELGYPRALLGQQLQGTTGDVSVEAFLGRQLGFDRDVDPHKLPEPLRNIASFVQSLGFLQQRTVGELSLALRGTLDLYAHRLDAWITALATKRLDDMRAAAAVADPGGAGAGLHLGAWGVVENLRPDAANQSADSLGYVHAPSLQQATTAAILRSGHIANRADAAGAFDIDLHSARVRRARRLLEGIARGQSMAALLGYRFERGLRDGDLSQHILDFRRAYPLRPAGEQASDEAQEDIAARDVVDGVRLIAEYRERGIAGISPAKVPAADQPRIAPLIDGLIELMDAVADLLVAESVHQIVGGNMDAAGAAMQTLDKQTRPPDTRVVDTPHGTRGYTQRVVVALQSVVPEGWEHVADDDLAAQVEPRLNAWLAHLIGDPARYAFGARVLQAQPDPTDRVDASDPAQQGRPPRTIWVDSGQRLRVGLADLGLSPLALVLGSEAEQAGGQSAVQERLALRFEALARANFGAAADAMAIALEAEAPDPALRGLVAFESFAWLLRRLLEKARPLRRMDMVQAVDGIETEALLADGEFAGIDAQELAGRLDIAQKSADEVLAALGTATAALPADDLALAALDPADAGTQALFADLETALAAAHALGWRNALATAEVPQSAADGSPGGAAAAQVRAADTLLRAAARARALLAELTARLADAPPPDGSETTNGARVRKLLARLRAILGEDFPLLPLFTLGGYAPEAAASLAARAALLGRADLHNDDLAIAAWLPKLGCVREATGRLADVLSAAEAQGLDTLPGDLKLLQFPQAAGAHWGALPPARGQDLRGVVAVVAHAPKALDAITPGDGLAGLFLDEWMESIPASQETTGLGFHFDAPGARPPQAVLLAVPGDSAAEQWTLDALIGAVDEALALSRLRAVRPQDLQGLGLMLPGIFLSNNFARDQPTVDFGTLMQKNLATLRVAQGLGAGDSARMVAGKTYFAP